jgi:hypothetical protein
MRINHTGICTVFLILIYKVPAGSVPNLHNEVSHETRPVSCETGGTGF